MAAMAMMLPTIARMRAYSAAEAPDSSFIILMRVFILRLEERCIDVPLPARGGDRGAVRRRPLQSAVGGVVRRTLRIDAGRSAVHRVADGVTQSDGGDGDDAANDRQDEGIFGCRSARFVLHHLDESLHS